VTGHGVASGFVMMMVNALISAFSENSTNGAEILSSTNTVLKPRIRQNMMMTCVMLRWDSVNKKMYFTGAGHEFILVYKAKEKKVYKVKTGGVALGMMRKISKALVEQQIAFEENDLIRRYSDGITEARYRSEQNGMLFGVDRIIEAIMKTEVRTPEMVFRQLTLDLSAFMGYKHVQYDDITLAIVGYSPNGEAVTMMDIPKRIDPTSITEWNW
jgi:serine phosphatase RsbU (regulator of sigma subunit)